MNGENLKTTMYNAVDFEFFVEYRNSLTPEELVVSKIDFEGMGIYWGDLYEQSLSGKSCWFKLQ